MSTSFILLLEKTSNQKVLLKKHPIRKSYSINSAILEYEHENRSRKFSDCKANKSVVYPYCVILCYILHIYI
jgi:hypothetical protein